MPLYDYRCKACQHQWKESRRIAERSVPVDTPCPECGKEGEIFQVIGTSSIVAGVRLTDKRPEGWKDVLRGVHKTAGKKSSVDV